jgi:hypothetical protein
MEKKVIYGQTLKDVCLYVYGSVSNLGKLMSDNNFIAGDVPIVGTTIIYDETIGNNSIKSYYAKNNIIPTTGLKRNDGIGSMIIEQTFIIS